MTKILLVRHGATDWNVTKRAQGQADVPLNDLGRRQAREAAELLAGMEIDAVYASDLSRAAETARAIAELHGLDVTTDPRFREVDQGEWTGLTNDEIRRRWPDRWGPARHHSARPGGESPGDVRRRALDGLERVVRRHPDATVVVVSHGGTIRWLSAESLGLDDRGSAHLRGLDTGGMVVLEGRIEDGELALSDLARLDGQPPERDDPNV